MIDANKEIVQALRETFAVDVYDVYTESIEQGFTPPCFSIRQLGADVTPHPAGITEIVQRYDVRFFPSDERRLEECRAVAGKLLPILTKTEHLRGSSMNWEITDSVLHFFVNYRQRVRTVPSVINMEVLEQDTALVED